MTLRILHIEDDAVLARAATAKLRGELDCEVEVAGTLAAGGRAARSGHWDLIILDYVLPDGSGLDLLRELDLAAPVIVLTGRGSQQVAVDALKLGAWDYLVKDGQTLNLLPDRVRHVVDAAAREKRLVRFREFAFDISRCAEFDATLDAAADGAMEVLDADSAVVWGQIEGSFRRSAVAGDPLPEPQSVERLMSLLPATGGPPLAAVHLQPPAGGDALAGAWAAGHRSVSIAALQRPETAVVLLTAHRGERSTELAEIWIEPLLNTIASTISRVGVLEESRLAAMRDPLTGLPNRGYLDRLIRQERERALGQGKPLGLLYVGIDGFKEVNDVHGSLEGDAILHRFGSLLRQSTRDCDVSCRLDSDRFVVVLPGADLEGTLVVGSRCCSDVRAAQLVPDVSLTISAGAASAPESGDANQLLEIAERGMRAAKRAGGDHCEGPPSEAASAGEPPPPGVGPRILHIEDDAFQASVVRRPLLEELSAEVTQVGTLEEGKAEARSKDWDVILLDHHLPDGVGLELLRDLRQRGQQTPVIVFTSSGSEDLAVEAMELGAADYIVKSARGIAELPARITEVLHQTAE